VVILRPFQVLICSNNNKPIDGIIQKLELSYHNKEIYFPFLRLGNIRDVQKVTKKNTKIFWNVNQNYKR